MNIEEIMESRKMGMPKLKVIRFYSADVIATSTPFLEPDEYELISQSNNLYNPGSYINPGNNTQ